ncbi:MAG: helix-turn-helix domain-containing protein, partial [Myxococcota bacterium]|nr:helix-turn-helix domain-containing protein [Myxococcota bacterium]
DETIGARVRRLRLARGLSAVGLSREVSVTEAAIRAIETGDSKSPSFVVGVLLAETLGVTPRYLAFGQDPVLEDRLRTIERHLGIAPERSGGDA